MALSPTPEQARECKKRTRGRSLEPELRVPAAIPARKRRQGAQSHPAPPRLCPATAQPHPPPRAVLPCPAQRHPTPTLWGSSPEKALPRAAPVGAAGAGRCEAGDVSSISRTAPGFLLGIYAGAFLERFAPSEAVLGVGQFGAVKECTDVITGERLACKTLRSTPGAHPASSTPSAAQVEELTHEVGAMLRMRGCKSAVQLRGVCTGEVRQGEALSGEGHPGDMHLVMELCEGGDLFEEVVRRGQFSERDAALLFTDAVRTVAACHARGVAHRDVKPENLLLVQSLRHAGSESIPLLARQGRPLLKLADFGLARSLAPGETLSGVAGSPFYMAPEVLEGPYSLAADVWSLGVVLYVLLCGCPPFWGESDAEVFEAVKRGAPDLESAPWDMVSQEAKSLVRSLLEKDPARRPPAQAVLEHRWLAHHCAAPAPATPSREHVRALPFPFIHAL